MCWQLLHLAASGMVQSHRSKAISDYTGKDSCGDEVSRPVQTFRLHRVGQGDDFVERMRML